MSGRLNDLGGCLGRGLVSLPVGFKYSDQSCDFEFKLRVDRRGVVERVKAADCFETTGRECDLGGAKISGGAFEGVSHPFDGNRVGIGQCRSDVGQHSLVPIEKQADELSEQLTVAADVPIHFCRVKGSSGWVGCRANWFLLPMDHRIGR